MKDQIKTFIVVNLSAKRSTWKEGLMPPLIFANSKFLLQRFFLTWFETIIHLVLNFYLLWNFLTEVSLMDRNHLTVWSITWLYYVSDIWPFATMTICQKYQKKFAKVGRFKFLPNIKTCHPRATDKKVLRLLVWVLVCKF